MCMQKGIKRTEAMRNDKHAQTPALQFAILADFKVAI